MIKNQVGETLTNSKPRREDDPAKHQVKERQVKDLVLVDDETKVLVPRNSQQMENTNRLQINACGTSTNGDRSTGIFKKEREGALLHS